jgi:hypothetical protein
MGRRIIRNEAHVYSALRFSPGSGAIHLYRSPSRVRRALSWMRWWHWTMLAVSLMLILDARF